MAIKDVPTPPNPSVDDAWGCLAELLERGWAVTFDPVTREAIATRQKAKMVAVGPTWIYAIQNLAEEVKGMGPYPSCGTIRNNVLSELPSYRRHGPSPDSSKSGSERVRLIGQACEALGFPCDQFRITLDLSRSLNDADAIRRATTAFGSWPINAAVIQRGCHWDRCTQLVLEWPKD